MFTSFLSLAALPLLALASPQYGYGPAPGPSTASTTAAAALTVPSSTANQINVNVGGSGLTFSPSSFNASNGTTVNFYFPSSLQHSVTQSTFANPCSPLSGSNGTGFDSGLTQGTVYSIQITNDQTPIWFFCKFPAHCGLGMVGAINAPSSGNTFDAFMSAAKSIGSSEASVPDNGPVTSGGVNAQASAAPTTPGASSPTTTGGSSSNTTSGAKELVASTGMGLVAIFLVVALAA
ncbi:Serine-rich & Multicopper Oxidase-related [Abortiporus biennis]